MIGNHALLDALRRLIAEATSEEHRDAISLGGSDHSADALRAFLEETDKAHLNVALRINGELSEIDDLFSSDTWSLSLGKSSLIEALGVVDIADDTALLFLSPANFLEWANRQLILAEGFSWTGQLTILIDGIDAIVAGPALRAGPLTEELPSFDVDARKTFPSRDQFASLVYFSSALSRRRLTDSALTRGDLGSDWFAPLRRWAEVDAAVLLTHEIAVRDSSPVGILRGARRAELHIVGTEGAPTVKALREIQTAVAWVFSEHAEARHALVVDRLGLEHVSSDTLLSLTRRTIKGAHDEARDRYRLFVLEKKDSASKELRDVLKDVRVQADLYSSKARDLVSNSLRDVLATFLLIGLGLIGRLDADKLADLTKSPAVDAFVRLLAIYFVLSAVIQITVQGRDMALTQRELQRWLLAARSQLPIDTINNAVEDGIRPRRTTFIAAAFAVTVMNGSLAVAFFYWKDLLQWVLH